jgi:hypothetical protein
LLGVQNTICFESLAWRGGPPPIDPPHTSLGKKNLIPHFVVIMQHTPLAFPQIAHLSVLPFLFFSSTPLHDVRCFCVACCFTTLIPLPLRSFSSQIGVADVQNQ